MDTVTAVLAMMPTWFWILTLTLFGLAIGSFLNVVIYRLPYMIDFGEDDEAEDEDNPTPDSTKSKSTNASDNIHIKNPVVEKITFLEPKRSFCPNCGHQITALENIPVFSYLALRGRCSGCKQGISPIYPMVEALTAIGFLLAFYKQTNQQTFSPLELLADIIFICACIVLIFIDYNHQLLPDVITLPGFVLALGAKFFIYDANRITYPAETFTATFFAGIILFLLALFLALAKWSSKFFQAVLAIILLGGVLFVGLSFNNLIGYLLLSQQYFTSFWDHYLFHYPIAMSLFNGVIGSIIGAGSLFALSEGYFLVRGVEGMGFGDVKMMLFVGMFLGWQLTLCTLFLAPLLAIIPVTIILVRFRGDAMQQKLPFGVFLGLGAIASVIFGYQLVSYYFQMLRP